MPTYEYRCPAGHDFEHFVLRMSEASGVMPCPTCGAEAQRKISAGGGLLFKGSGFYITDYGKDGKKDQRKPAAVGASSDKPAEGGAASAPASDSGAAGKGDAAKPAAAAPEKSSKAPEPAKKKGPSTSDS